MLFRSPGCPPRLLPVRFAFAFFTPGPSDEGGFDEFCEFWPSRARNTATSASSSVIRTKASRSSCSSSAMRASRGSVVTCRNYNDIAIFV